VAALKEVAVPDIGVFADVPEVAWAGPSIHPHPTSSETVGIAAEVALGVVTDLPPARSHLRTPALAVAGGPSGAHVRAVTWH
jgi:hypothetical protein